MTPLHELANRLRQSFPGARVDFAEPMQPGGVGFLDVVYREHVLAVQWQENWHFGLSSPQSHGYGEKPDEICDTVDAAAARIGELITGDGQTQPPHEVTLRELRVENNRPQAALLGATQPVVATDR